jgi:hypothetical protein
MPISKIADTVLDAESSVSRQRLRNGTTNLATRPPRVPPNAQAIIRPQLKQFLQDTVPAYRKPPFADLFEVRKYECSQRIPKEDSACPLRPASHSVIRQAAAARAESVLQILKKKDFTGVIIPDHAPQMRSAAPWHAGMAYAPGHLCAGSKMAEG